MAQYRFIQANGVDFRIDAPRNVKGSFSGFLVGSSAGVAARQGWATKASS